MTLPNIADVQRTAEQERNADRLTIEPGSFEADLEHWGQPEFYNFWDRVIEDHAAEVRFMPGWELSVGCTFEYLCARKHGRTTLDIDGNPLLVETALGLLHSALREIQSRYDPNDPRDEPIAELYAGLTRFRQAIDVSRAIADGD